MQQQNLMTWSRWTPKLFPHGPSPIPFILTSLLTFLPSILLTIVSNDTVIKILFIVLQFLTLLSMSLTSYTNPGIIPQIIPHYERDPDMFPIPSEPIRPNSHRKYIICNRDMTQHMKYCFECGIYRPLRSIHCDKCNHCVEKYDHHCPWLGICIGKYNYKYFLFYLITIILMAGVAVAMCSHAIYEGLLNSQPITTYAIPIAELIFSTCTLLPLLSLLTYHLQLIHHRLTTNEEIRKIYHKINNHVPFPRTYCNSKKSTPNPIYHKKDIPMQDTRWDKGDRYHLLLNKKRSVLSNLLDSSQS